ncbi:MAG: triose-phosphate isomerase, partial [Desulfurococcaceae archaeon]
MKPIIAVNFKAYYPHSFGEKALKLAESARKVWEETGIKIVLAPPYTEIRSIVKYLEGSEVEVYAQHADP